MRTESIKSISFVDEWIPLSQNPGYQDSFNLLVKDEELIIPDLVIKLKGLKEPLAYWDLVGDEGFLGLGPHGFDSQFYLESGFVCVIDDNEEKIFIPVSNIECMEAKRDLVIDDKEWVQWKKVNKSTKTD